jgi:hypothetical protein
VNSHPNTDDFSQQCIPDPRDIYNITSFVITAVSPTLLGSTRAFTSISKAHIKSILLLTLNLGCCGTVAVLRLLMQPQLMFM